MKIQNDRPGHTGRGLRGIDPHTTMQRELITTVYGIEMYRDQKGYQLESEQGGGPLFVTPMMLREIADRMEQNEALREEKRNS